MTVCDVIVFGNIVRPLDDVDVFFMLSVSGDDDFELLFGGDGIQLLFFIVQMKISFNVFKLELGSVIAFRVKNELK